MASPLESSHAIIFEALFRPLSEFEATNALEPRLLSHRCWSSLILFGINAGLNARARSTGRPATDLLTGRELTLLSSSSSSSESAVKPKASSICLGSLILWSTCFGKNDSCHCNSHLSAKYRATDAFKCLEGTSILTGIFLPQCASHKSEFVTSVIFMFTAANSSWQAFTRKSWESAACFHSSCACLFGAVLPLESSLCLPSLLKTNHNLIPFVRTMDIKAASWRSLISSRQPAFAFGGGS
mmetsp:Transcript_31860/g.49554  ORF Transcript_31860/g.49554 Transcript_31860/m.49554 type:complete len:241 (+) Transcript_31860:529-1251(+)